MNTKEFMEEKKLVCIIRRIYGEELLRLAAALHKGGVELIECTFDQADPHCAERTAEAIDLLGRSFGGEMLFGAGTVLTPEQVTTARDAGARYIISPNVNPAVIARTKELGLVSIPGAMTPTEILSAHELGADFVKLFPATTLGFKYISDIMAPISHVKLMATGGVTEENLGEYLSRGFMGAGISGRLADKKLIAAGDWEEITRRARVFTDIAAGD